MRFGFLYPRGITWQWASIIHSSACIPPGAWCLTRVQRIPITIAMGTRKNQNRSRSFTRSHTIFANEAPKLA